jgi:hypothetical protein
MDGESRSVKHATAKTPISKKKLQEKADKFSILAADG